MRNNLLLIAWRLCQCWWWIKDWFIDPCPWMPGVSRKKLMQNFMSQDPFTGKWYFWGHEITGPAR